MLTSTEMVESARRSLQKALQKTRRANYDDVVRDYLKTSATGYRLISSSDETAAAPSTHG
jgi:hypothetical protein